jgi:hypothetical protein
MMSDADIYDLWCSGATLLGRAAEMFEVVAEAIRHQRSYVIDAEVAQKECSEILRAIYITNILAKSEYLIHTSRGNKSEIIFMVGDSVFSNIDDAARAAKMKAFL